jgi:hypothetical protein
MSIILNCDKIDLSPRLSQRLRKRLSQRLRKRLSQIQ